MPLYEFQCRECDEAFEELVRSSAAIDEVKCPTCGSPQIHRKVSMFASKGASSGGRYSSAASSCAPGGT